MPLQRGPAWPALAGAAMAVVLGQTTTAVSTGRSPARDCPKIRRPRESTIGHSQPWGSQQAEQRAILPTVITQGHADTTGTATMRCDAKDPPGGKQRAGRWRRRTAALTPSHDLGPKPRVRRMDHRGPCSRRGGATTQGVHGPDKGQPQPRDDKSPDAGEGAWIDALPYLTQSRSHSAAKVRPAGPSGLTRLRQTRAWRDTGPSGTARASKPAYSSNARIACSRKSYVAGDQIGASRLSGDMGPSYYWAGL